MLEIVHFRDDWPGLSRSAGRSLSVSTAGLYSLASRFERDGNRSRAELRAFEDRAGTIASQRYVAQTFGQWHLAQILWEAHSSAFSSATEVGAAIGQNLISVAHRIGVTRDVYERLEAQVHGMSSKGLSRTQLNPENFRLRREKGWSSALAPDQYYERLRDRPRYEELLRTSRSNGELPVLRQLVDGENSRHYSSSEIEFWLRLLQQAQAWTHHFEAAMGWHSMASMLHDLSGVIYGRAVEMDQNWQSVASAVAQEALQQIEGSTRSLAGFSGTIAYAVDASAVALQETVENLRIGWANRSRAARDVFDLLSSRYAAIIDLYPRALPFTLPFGGVSLAHRPSEVRETPASPVAETAPPAEDSKLGERPEFPYGVIGDAAPPAFSTRWDDDARFWEPGDHGIPPVIR